MRKNSANHAIEAGAYVAGPAIASFLKMGLPIHPPFPPMEAKSAPKVPSGADWVYEPKWDGFRCLAFRSGNRVVLQSKSGQPLGRYFPELVKALHEITPGKFVLDGEIIVESNRQLSFDKLLMRIHPAASRIQKLSELTPCTDVTFDLLVDGHGKSLLDRSLAFRRKQLLMFAREHVRSRRIRISPQTPRFHEAEEWMENISTFGFDGVMAKHADLPYLSGERTGMVKIKRLRTADCVVGGFRFGRKGREVGSLLLGLYNGVGQLDHVGYTSSFAAANRNKLRKILKPYFGGTGFTGKAPGGPSRWSTDRSGEWEPLAPKLVCEVRYDHFSGDRFRHGTKFLRWRPDKSPRQCTLDQISPEGSLAA